MLMFLFWGCASVINYATVQRIAPKGLATADLGKACRLGESLHHVLPSFSQNDPDLAMVISETTAGLCEEFDAWESELQKERSLKNLPLGPTRIAEVKDAQFRADRAHKRAAIRYYAAFEHLENHLGALGVDDSCPYIEPQEEMPFVIGGIAGVLAVLHDKQSGGQAGVPVDILPRIARVMECIDNDDWWYAPQAIQGSVWVTIPGSGPENIDPWTILTEAAQKGAPAGVRVGWAMHNLIGANSGENHRVQEGIVAHATSISVDAADPKWRLLDEYAYWITRHQSDLIWTREMGYRTENLGILPSTKSPTENSLEEDAFEEDLFEEDLFEEDATEIEETEETEETEEETE